MLLRQTPVQVVFGTVVQAPGQQGFRFIFGYRSPHPGLGTVELVVLFQVAQSGIERLGDGFTAPQGFVELAGKDGGPGIFYGRGGCDDHFYPGSEQSLDLGLVGATVEYDHVQVVLHAHEQGEVGRPVGLSDQFQ